MSPTRLNASVMMMLRMGASMGPPEARQGFLATVGQRIGCMKDSGDVPSASGMCMSRMRDRSAA